MVRRLYLLINGILTNPGNVSSWTDLAEEWIEDKTPFYAERYEYCSGIFSGKLFQGARVENVYKILERHRDYEISLVGHSNGGDIITRLINKYPFMNFNELHLVASASEADFEKNGLNKALKTCRVKSIYCYCSNRDEALEQARLSSKIWGWTGLAYGYLGLVGPKNVDPNLQDCVLTKWEAYGHSDWWNAQNFEKTIYWSDNAY